MNPTIGKKNTRVLLIISIAAVILSVVTRSVLTVTTLDARYGVYEHGNAIPTIYHILLLVICLLMAGYALISAKSTNKAFFPASNSFTVFASFACGFLLAADFLITFITVAANGLSPTRFDIIEICFSVPAIIYFIAIAVKPKSRSSVLALASLFPIAWCAVCLIRMYFDTTVLMTSPDRILGQIALLSAMIFFLSEARIRVSNFSHRLFTASASVAPVLLLTHAVPNLLFANRLAIGESYSTIRCAVEIAFALFAYARLSLYNKEENLSETAK